MSPRTGPLGPSPHLRRRGGVAILVYNIDSTGGMERQASRLAERFAGRGRRVAIVSTFFPTAKKNPPFYEVRNGVLLYRLPMFNSPWWSYTASQALYETLAAWLLHRHVWVDTVYAIQGNTGGLHGAKVAHALARPSIVKLACSGKAGDLSAIEREHQDPSAAFALLRRLDRVVHLNEASRDEALAAGIAPARLIHIPNGIDPSPFRDLTPAALPELGSVEGRELILFIGRLDHQKRVGVLLEAFARVAARRPRARLAILGQGSLRTELEVLVHRLGVADRVFFAGVRDDVPRVLRAASIYVLPSAEEGISNALLEAMAAGTPVVASDIPGNRDLVRNEEEGLLVPVDDVSALEGAIDRLLADRLLAERFARAARQRVDEVYHLDRVAQRYLELFDSLPRGPRPGLGRFLIRVAGSGLTPLTWLAFRGALGALVELFHRATPYIDLYARKIVTSFVIVTKRLLGIGRPVSRGSRDEKAAT